MVQYRNSPHVYGCTFETGARTTAGIARAAARAAREDLAYWTCDDYRAPVVTSIDGIALIPRDWEDREMWQVCDMIDREASKQRPPKRHDSAERPSVYA